MIKTPTEKELLLNKIEAYRTKLDCILGLLICDTDKELIKRITDIDLDELEKQL